MKLEQVKSIFADAAALISPQERSAFLDSACAGDPALRAQVESLLADRSKAEGFLETLVIAPGPSDGTEFIGGHIGPYKLLEKIGEGGFGLVYMAEQKEPVRRKVALKIIKAGMDTKQVIARFEAERQALALMDHPNIAKVLDAGETENPQPVSDHPRPSDGRRAGGEGGSHVPSGRPYFVMELVKGVPITQFCQQNDVSLRDRLDLFIKVCHAVQHAHQKGIIHRDIKPSNVMVTMIDGLPVPKVIDFGVAKAVGQQLTERTLFTRYDQLIGTPAYMSPEQAALSGQDVDTRSDIYSLGGLLYELLTGTAPIDAETLRQAGLDEIRRMIRETDPPKPSTRLTAKSEIPNLKSEIQHVRGDLDWIVMKCLEKDRNRRYETALGLAGDLQRHLDNEPVLARPPSTVYRIQKLVRRHKLAFAAGTAIAAALLLGVVLTLLGFAEARRERDRALKAEQQAEANERTAKEEAVRSEQVAKFLEEMLKGAGPAVALGRDTTVLREILDKTATRLDEFTNFPAVKADLHSVLGGVYHELGQYTNALAMHREALSIRRGLYGTEDAKVAASALNVGGALLAQNRSTEAEPPIREALAIRKKLRGGEHSEIARSLGTLAWSLADKGRMDEAEALYREAIDMDRKLHGNDRKRVAIQLNNYANVLERKGKVDEAADLFREALEIFGKKYNGEEHPDLALPTYNLARMRSRQGNLAEAEALHRRALELRKKFLGLEHPEVEDSVHGLAEVLTAMRKFDDAEALYRDFLAESKKLLGDENRRVAHCLAGLALVYKWDRRLNEAETLARQSLAMLEKLFGHEHEEMFSGLALLAGVIKAHDGLEEAERLWRECLVRSRRLFGEDHTTGRMLWNIASVLREQKKLEESEEHWRRALAVLRKVLGEEHREVAMAFFNLGAVQHEEKKYAEAEANYQEALKRASGPGPNPLDRPRVLSAIGNVLVDQGKPEKGLPVLSEAVELARDTGTNSESWYGSALYTLAEGFYRLGQYAESEKYYRECIAVARAGNGDVRSPTASLGRLLADWGWQEYLAREPTTVAATDRLPGPVIELVREAESILREALEHRIQRAKTNSSPSQWRTGDYQSRLGDAVAIAALLDVSLAGPDRQTKIDEAEQMLIAGLRVIEGDPSWTEAKYQLDALKRLARFYEATDRPQQAADWKEKLAEFEMKTAHPR